MKEMLLSFVVQPVDEVVQPDLADRDQARVVDAGGELGVQQVEITVLRVAGAERMNAQPIGVTLRVGQIAHCQKVERRHSRNDAQTHVFGGRAGAHRRLVCLEFSRVQMAMCINE